MSKLYYVNTNDNYSNIIYQTCKFAAIKLTHYITIFIILNLINTQNTF